MDCVKGNFFTPQVLMEHFQNAQQYENTFHNWLLFHS